MCALIQGRGFIARWAVLKDFCSFLQSVYKLTAGENLRIFKVIGQCPFVTNSVVGANL